ncbi:hypothetical protein [Streptomyces sp. NBC_01800]|uniref:hypothetical protein n=1 Tax=Streptomyces sp. NBC_01800 TaxID=2975945 RepID=UPI002DDB4704|nr:hypothetical protein [Streptomyces sp. NBC_01800]WSA72266.1 hypothetical protein OIE65_37975 [Streptomyces sp. NBC_01800]
MRVRARSRRRDPTVLGELTDLRHLSLTGRRWTTLLDEGNVPPTLTTDRPPARPPGADAPLARAAGPALNTK